MSKQSLEGKNTNNNVLTTKGKQVFKRRNKVKVLVGTTTGVIGIGTGIGVGYAIFHNNSQTPTPESKLQRVELNLQWKYYEDYVIDEETLPDIVVGTGKFNGVDVFTYQDGYTSAYDVNDGSCEYNKPIAFQCYETKSGVEVQQQYFIFPENMEKYMVDQFNAQIDGDEINLLNKDITPEQKEYYEFRIKEMKKLVNGENAELIDPDGDHYYAQLFVLTNWDELQKQMFEAYKNQ